MSDSQGFESPKHEYSMQSDHFHYVKHKVSMAKSILKQTNHSLQPDMHNGWKPKLPSCPLPLTYLNTYNEQLMSHIPTDDRFKIVYLGKRYVNSVQINQQYSYFWRYRQRYSLNLALIQQAVKNVGKSHHKIAEDIQKNHSTKQLSFDSSFESGNLELAVKVKPHEYDLFLRSDTNTRGHTNWYYFKVNNQNFLGTVQLNICNIGKTKTLYNKGMKPYVLENNQKQWSQDKTFDVCFVQRYSRYGFDKKTFQLQFKYNFKSPNTQVLFAYGIPYTYSNLQCFMKDVTESHPLLTKSQKLCESLGGLNIPLLTISDQSYIKYLRQQEQLHQNLHHHHAKKLFSEQEDLSHHKQNKKAVLITGRIHPGQSNASHVLEGFIKELLKDNETSKKVRQNYVFYIIPMLNPDGVVAGNFRTSYSGKDLNRQFKRLNKNIFPQIFHLSELTLKLKQNFKKKLQFYFDFHGHSSKKNIFCYGPEYTPSNILYFKSKTFAKIMEEVNPIFSYRRSIFEISESKKTTGRAFMLYNMKIPMTYTFEISNGVYETKQDKSILLNMQSLLLAGETVFKGFSKYVSIEMASSNSGGNIRAKVDTGIRTKRSSSTHKVGKQKSFLIPRFSSSKDVNQSQNNKQTLRMSLDESIKEIKHQNVNKQFEKYMKQIKKEQPFEIQEAEGGSDSQGSDQDLSKQELHKLQQFIMTRNKQTTQYNKRIYAFKIKPIDKQIKRKNSLIEENENKQNKKTENLRIKILPNKSFDSSKRSLNVSQKTVALKKPPLPLIPMPKILQKVALNQVAYKFQF